MTDRDKKCADVVDAQWASVKADLERFMEAEDEETDEEFRNYALSFDYVAPGTFTDQDEGYWRYQMSWGGPSDEIRFFGDAPYSAHRAEYWFLDWFDGASINVTAESCVWWLWEDLAGLGVVRSTYDEAMEDA